MNSLPRKAGIAQNFRKSVLWNRNKSTQGIIAILVYAKFDKTDSKIALLFLLETLSKANVHD